MKGYPLILSYVAAIACIVAAVPLLMPTSAPALPVEQGRMRYVAVESAEDSATTARLADKARIEALLASARPPVPMILPAKEGKYATDGSTPEPAVDAAAAAKATAPEAMQAMAKAKIEADGYKAVRVTGRAPDGRWLGIGRRGNTEIALSVDDQGNVASQ